ncbi:TetR/AcrR family transcriptional regulator C-terminal domain-containing protein [Cupriavidus basilensis]
MTSDDGQPRKVGRRPKLGSAPSLTREDVVNYLIGLAQREPFSEITAARLARELGVVPSLVNYFLGSRDDMLGLVFNHALKELAENSPPLTGEWRPDAEAHVRQGYATLVKWKGVTTYMAAHNKYRIFQNVPAGEIDFGLIFYDRMGRIFKAGGFSPEDGARAYHLLMLFLTAVASAQIFGREPAAQRQSLLAHVEQFPAYDFPGAYFLINAFIGLDTESTFESGLELMLDGFEKWREKRVRMSAEQA